MHDILARVTRRHQSRPGMKESVIHGRASDSPPRWRQYEDSGRLASRVEWRWLSHLNAHSRSSHDDTMVSAYVNSAHERQRRHDRFYNCTTNARAEIFATRRYVSAVYAIITGRVCVRPFVCLSQAGILMKRLFFYHCLDLFSYKTASLFTINLLTYLRYLLSNDAGC